jgi:hypothetical protein
LSKKDLNLVFGRAYDAFEKKPTPPILLLLVEMKATVEA